jgi:hypothetical protein
LPGPSVKPVYTFAPPTGPLFLINPDHPDTGNPIMKNGDYNDVSSTGEPLLPLIKEIRELVQRARRTASRNVNILQVSTNFEIGRMIVEHEQKGKRRAEYGERVVRELARRLTDELGRGFSFTNLKYMRQFYLEYHETTSLIPERVSAKSSAHTKTGCINWSDSVWPIRTRVHSQLVPLRLPHEY